MAQSPATLEALRLVDRYAPATTPVILVGDTGTGKTFFARLIHELGGRSREPFTVLTAGELRGSLGDDVLFGHERGAFTGAQGRRGGMLQDAGRGTLLIDDFHHLGQGRQVRLLRVLEEGRYRPHGANREVPAQCRVIIALRHDPDRLMREGVLLRDIRYRLGHCIIRLPALAARREEIPLLAHQFLSQCPRATGVADGPTRFAAEVPPILVAAPWPGNLRDLRKAVESAYLEARGECEIRINHLPVFARQVFRYDPQGPAAANRRAVERALALVGGDVREAARLCGASRATVYRFRSPRASHLSQPPQSVRQEIDGAVPASHAG